MPPREKSRPRTGAITIGLTKASRTIVPVLGEGGGLLYLDPKLPAGSLVVVEGRALLDLRTVFPEQDEALVQAISKIAEE